MRLSRFRVTNHSRLKDLDIEVRKHLVLVGPNDVGKSSLLRCMDLLLGASVAQLYARLEASDFRHPDQPLVIEADLWDFDPTEEALFPDEITVDPEADSRYLTLRLEATLDESQTLSIRRSAPGGGTGRLLSREQVNGISWKTISAVAGTRDLRDDRNTAVDDILKAIDLGAEQDEFTAIAKLYEQKLQDSTALDTLRDQLANQLSKALPETIDKSELSFVPGASADNDVLSDVRLQVRREGTLRNLSDQSDGTRALFAIALYDLVSSSANMVGIDEPEIHLHPSSQRSLARLLQDSGNQKIVATHSTDIVGAFPAEYIVAVKPGGRVVQPKADFLSQDERTAVRWWVRDKLEPLTAAHVVAVEGISDRIILEQAAVVTGRELDRLGVSVVETSGSGDMGAIFKIFGDSGFQVEMSMLIDEDAAEETARKLGVAVGDLGQRSVWVSRPDLEAEYVGALGAENVWQALTDSSLFTSSELSNCRASGPGGVRSADDVAAFCRSKKPSRKVRAAIAVAPLIDAHSAKAISSIEQVLRGIAVD